MSGSLALRFFAGAILANSSWTWVSNRPIDILPFVIVATLFIEIILIIKCGHVSSIVKPIIVITAANLVSFVAPYGLTFLLPNELGMSAYDYFQKMMNYWPSYIVGLGYLLLTLIIEVPIVYNVLKVDSENRRVLLVTIVIVNIATTLLVALVERLVCVGQW